ncbi:hypothetical protein PV05_00876 [Exophiala xenobiotica]|uniref:Secreted protein n=1 Tax=Exophiala xenobiotica TaxID=348802 RepID=A0A0D2C6Y6_9EURO|nr:uncharacterized protein PV05_00876 [Exophiala xenobiotica]KIW60676.1 hypothetical protein PV05_00876 [Exophiala xenobiotica]
MRTFAFFIPSLLLAAFAGFVASQDDTLVIDTPTLTEDHADYIDAVDVDHITKRSPPAGIYVCSQANWAGKCTWLSVTENTCKKFGWNSDISFGVPVGWQCKFYWGEQCGGSKRTDGKLTIPGTTNFAYSFGKEAPISYKCRQCPGKPGCSNGNAPDFFEATSKTGEVGYDGKCRVFTDGAVATQPC